MKISMWIEGCGELRLRILAPVMVLFVVVIHPGNVFAEEHIRVGSFNIAELGEGNHSATRHWPAMAKMLTDNELDLIAIQEVGVGPQAEKDLQTLVEKMNEWTVAENVSYVYLVTPQSGDERCGFIYRDPVVEEGEVMWLDDDKEPGNPGKGGEDFYRIPVAVGFHAKDFDFVVVSMHLHWTNVEQRGREVAELKEFLSDDSDPEKDWIVVGDMNRYGKCTENATKPFDKLLVGNWRPKYRFPLLEAITEPDNMKVWKASADEYCTTVSGNGAVYDQIIITSGAYREFEADDPRFDTNVGIVAFDREEPYVSKSDHNYVKYSVSDHRPIWARFRIDAGDDD